MMTKHYTQAELDTAVKAERYRHQLVLASADYQGREAAARHMLSSTDMSSAKIIEALSGMTAGEPQHGAQGGQQNDFQKGKEIASRMPAAMRK